METIIDGSEENSVDFWNPHQEEDGPYHMSQEELYQHFIMEQHQRMLNEYSIVNECVLPTLSQGLDSVWLLFLVCLVLRVLGVLRVNQRFLHLASALAGLVVLNHMYSNLTVYIVYLCIAGYIGLFVLNRIFGNGASMAILCVSFLLMCEKYLVAEMDWNRIRGSVMVVSMKLIYIGFERQNITSDGFGFLGYFGYVLNPASIIFGPFITYKEYMQMSLAHSLTPLWALHVLKTILFSAVCLLWSTCGNSFVLPKLGSSRWLDAFRDANGFRFSTYFVSFTSEAACLMMGVGTMHAVPNESKMPKTMQDAHREIQDNINQEAGYIKMANDSSKNWMQQQNLSEEETRKEVHWTRPVSKPLDVEIPRSLVEVVTNWNLPMHYWLKNYVFKTSRRLGAFPAILLTYLASSLLHGLNFQLSVILLSIGIFAYIENGARKTLASSFSACIEARRCKPTCQHQYKKSNFLVICVNLGFGILAVWNLAYLGCLFDNDPDIQEQGYSMSHALRKWAALGYICHFIMFGVLVVNKLVKDGKLFNLPKWPVYLSNQQQKLKLA